MVQNAELAVPVMSEPSTAAGETDISQPILSFAVRGGEGADLFVFGEASVTAVAILDFDPTEDRISLEFEGADASTVTYDAGSGVLSYDDGGGSLVLAQLAGAVAATLVAGLLAGRRTPVVEPGLPG